MASSTHHLHSATSAPPPTPSTQPPTTPSSSSADFLSRLLHRLPPPSLSLPTRRPSPPTPPPLFSLSSADLLLSSPGFFQISDHNISSQLAESAHSESISLFELTQQQKLSCFPKNFPSGYENDDVGENEQSFWLECNSSDFESADVDLGCLKSLSEELERVGLVVIEKLLKSVGLENPPTRFCSMMWVHESKGDKMVTSSDGFYPYVVCLEYQIRRRKYSLLSDSGWVTVLPQVDCVMVTVGDIAQVWSNGKLKKVRGKPFATLEDDDQSRNISMSLLLTLPLESTVSPLLPLATDGCNANESNEVKEEEEEEQENHEEDRLFNSFSFEDYAWRVYHEPFLSKDPLDRYRI